MAVAAAAFWVRETVGIMIARLHTGFFVGVRSLCEIIFFS